MESNSRKRALMGSAVVLLIAGLTFSAYQLRPFLVGPSAAPRPVFASAQGPASTESNTRNLPFPNPSSPSDVRANMRHLMETQLDLSAEQKKTIEGLMEQGPPKSPEEARERFQKVRATLNDEQREKMKQLFIERLKESPISPIKNLSEDEQAKFMEKLEKKLDAGEPPMLMLGPPPGMFPGRP
ncbi:MAG: hypothetical protein SFY68_03690 [Candidatus Sumerlaeia bacterium]|nr:hypothetical protein [Candidatus Sumerlaeia bacterium]